MLTIVVTCMLANVRIGMEFLWAPELVFLLYFLVLVYVLT